MPLSQDRLGEFSQVCNPFSVKLTNGLGGSKLYQLWWSFLQPSYEDHTIFWVISFLLPMLLLPELIDGSCPDLGIANYYHNNSLSLCFLSTRILWHQCHAEQSSAGLGKYHSCIQIFILHMQDNMHGCKWRGDDFSPLNKIKFSVRSCYAMECQLNECFCGDMDSLCVCVCCFPWGGYMCMVYMHVCMWLHM